LVVLEKSELEVWPTEEVCPNCGFVGLELRHLVYDNGQPFELFILICQKCGSREVEFVDSVFKRPVKYKVLVTRGEDLSTLVYRSPTASISIPELGVEITPTSRTLPRVSTIEGFIDDIKGRVEALSLGKVRDASKLSSINLVLEGRMHVTFILSDDYGSSWIKPAPGTTVKKIE
jgi:zinc finger protein